MCYYLSVFPSRLSYDVLLKLSELYRSIATTKPPVDPGAYVNTPAATPPTTTAVLTSVSHAQISSPKISLSAPDSVEIHKSPKSQDSDWVRQRKRSMYMSWAMVKTACQVSACQQQLRKLISEVHVESMNKTLDSYSLQILPEFAAMEICSSAGGSEDIAEVLAERVMTWPIIKLLPRNQTVPGVMELTWIRVINYYHRLLQRCMWQKTSLEASGSDWGLHYHGVTSELYVKAHAMQVFLSVQFPPFRECQFPPVPQHSSHAHKLISTNPSNLESHLLAGECELTVTWQPRCYGSKHDQVKGFFAFNQRPLQVPVQTAFHNTGIDVFITCTSFSKLADLRQEWAGLVEGSHAFLQQKEASMYRLVSARSPRPKKLAQPPEELVKRMTRAVSNMTKVLGVTRKEVKRFRVCVFIVWVTI